MAQTMTRDDFTAWLDHPVTKWVLSAFGEQAGALRNDWIDAAWNMNRLDLVEKTQAHTRWDMLSMFADLTYEDACGYAGVKPLEDEA